jgi:hypothetical protein
MSNLMKCFLCSVSKAEPSIGANRVNMFDETYNLFAKMVFPIEPNFQILYF